ncbi:MAG: selenium-dependent molybdenum cofactor biosynthesis protein YqeB [Spirochaetaceae bacterium]
MKIVIVRGAGDLATGIIQKLHNSGFKVIACEIEKPTAIRRMVSLSEAVYYGEQRVEDITAKLCTFEEAINDEGVSVIIDPKMSILERIKPLAVVDAILAKCNLGTTINSAKVVIGVGPGFSIGVDCHAVIETKRGHNLGKIYYRGSAIENTGIPGEIEGESTRRVLHAPTQGEIENRVNIGDIVQENDLMFTINNTPIYAPFSGVVRGIIKDGFSVFKGMKVADIDPRMDQVDKCNTISDKARNVAGGVLEAVVRLGEVI